MEEKIFDSLCKSYLERKESGIPLSTITLFDGKRHWRIGGVVVNRFTGKPYFNCFDMDSRNKKFSFKNFRRKYHLMQETYAQLIVDGETIFTPARVG